MRERRSRAPVSWRGLTAPKEPPAPHWSVRLLYHGARIGLLLVTAVVVYLFFPAPRIPDAAILERGTVAPHDVIAEFAFDVPKPEAELERERAEAEAGVPLHFDFVPAAVDSMVSAVRQFFAGVDSVRRVTPEEDERAAVRQFVGLYRVTPTPSALDLLLDDGQRAALLSATERGVREGLAEGVLAPAAVRETFTTARVRYPDGREDRRVPRDSLLSPDGFFSFAAQQLPDRLGAEAAELQRLLLIRLFQPSLVYNEAATQAARARARDAVEPVRAEVLAGEKVVGAREQIREREEERLRAYYAALRDRGLERGGHTTGRALGSILYNTVVLLILGLVFWFTRREVYYDLRALLLFAMLVVAVAGSAALIARFELPVELIPVTFAALIVAVLWEGRLGLNLTLVLALLIGGQAPFLGLSAPFTIAVGGAAATFAVRAVQRRSQTWTFILLISGAYLAAAVTLGLLRSREPVEVLYSVGWGTTNAIVASLLAIGFIPLLESLTRITTEQTLLELSDLNRRLLKRLSFEASGTYHHTINVANLAEAACHAIGANGLLARVGAYYHDIGKLTKPQFFIENQPKGRNPHDKLKPQMSASIIRSHVTEGLKLADQEGLPEVIRDFIAEHHGTQQISFFYDKARELEPDAQLNPADFTYAGPKPRSKETAVVMLADSVESASRVLQDPTPERLRDLVERIVASKLAEKQLDDSPLTLRDIDIVKDHLVLVLAGMYHQRIDYPPAPRPRIPPPAEGTPIPAPSSDATAQLSPAEAAHD